jgi:hypothetical protein
MGRDAGVSGRVDQWTGGMGEVETEFGIGSWI